MSGVSYLGFFLISHLVIVSLAQEGKGSSPKCQPFDCGNFGHLSFPFSNETYSECGILILEGCKKQVQEIQLGKNGPRFYVSAINPDGSLQLRDQPEFVGPSDYVNCTDSLKNLTIPSSPLVSFEVSPNNQTLFKCPGAHYSLPENYKAVCNDSKHSIIYFNGSNHHRRSSTVPSNCSLIPFKMNKTQKDLEFSNLFTGYFKMQVNVTKECLDCHRRGGHCQIDNRRNFHCPDAAKDAGNGKQLKTAIRIGVGMGAALATAIGILIVLAFYCWRKLSPHNAMVFWKKQTKNYQNIEAFLRNHGSLAPQRYSYSDIKKITNSFTQKLGQGGYGGVYKGRLLDGRYVAVKNLIESKGDGEEFINEVASISRTSHVNIVTLLGFCFEGHKRALIYEYMSNGSLEKFIYEKNLTQTGHQLKWETLHQIAIGIARGLEYLHRGCSTQILHFDIKPHNILLDEDFCPKISDFGLAKICPKKESIISMTSARGTIGYIAPEVFSRSFGVVSRKSDVYSYGMMVLEMVGGRRNIDIEVDRTSEIYLPHWIYQHLEVDGEFELQGIANEEDKEFSRKMIIVSLWCIQTNPLDRPTMSKVVEMLEGSLGSLEIPPKPFLSSPRSWPADSSTLLVC